MSWRWSQRVILDVTTNIFLPSLRGGQVERLIMDSLGTGEPHDLLYIYDSDTFYNSENYIICKLKLILSTILHFCFFLAGDKHGTFDRVPPCLEGLE